MVDPHAELRKLVPTKARKFAEVHDDLSRHASGAAEGQEYWVDLTAADLDWVRRCLQKAERHAVSGEMEQAWYYLLRAQQVVSERQGHMQAGFDDADREVRRKEARRKGSLGGQVPNRKVSDQRANVSAAIMSRHAERPFTRKSELKDAIFQLPEGDGRSERWFRSLLSSRPELGALYCSLQPVGRSAAQDDVEVEISSQ